MVKITDNAARAILDLAAAKGAGSGLRLSVEKGGCAGLQYIMEIGEPIGGDATIEHLGSRVFIDPASAESLRDCTLDYEDGLSGAGFRIRNPNAARSCGCGTSFEPAEAARA